MNHIIDGGNARYLSELPEFQEGLPHGIVNKTKTDVGGTYVAANCSSNYIIVCPFRDLVDSIAADKNNKYEVFKCYGKVTESAFKRYIKEHQIYKIAVTYDSLGKLLRWMNDKIEGWKLLIDEYHLILEDMDFRENAIMEMIYTVTKFDHYTFLSATPMDEDYEIDFFKQLPHYKVVWKKGLPIVVKKIKTTCLSKGLCNLIKIFRKDGFRIPDINGELKEVEQLFIFLNSVTTARQIADTLELDEDEIKICCAERKRNRLLLGKYQIESVCSPNKKINFFTKKCFQGCNLFSNNGLIIVASDAYRTQTLIDISTTMEQISGRLRENGDYKNIFRNTMVHIYSTNKNILTDEEFEQKMKKKEEDAARLLSLQAKADEKELATLIRKVNIETDLLSIINGRLKYNEIKKKSFYFKQDIRKTYKDGIYLRAKYDESEKFIQTNQELWKDFDIEMARAVTISYEQLLKDYLDHPTESYEQEYPEFKDFRRYLKETEMNSCRWNKDKMMKMVEDYKRMNAVYKAIYRKGFISSKDLKALFTKEFKKRGISISPKATQIMNCDLYEIRKSKVRIKGKLTDGYEIGDWKFKIEM